MSSTRSITSQLRLFPAVSVGWLLRALVLIATLAGTGSQAMAQGTFLDRLKNRNTGGDGAGSPTSETIATAIQGPGDYTLSLVHDGMTRVYKVHVPKSYSPSKPAPMLLAFHGGGGNMDYQADDHYYGQITKSEQIGYIAVFPNGYSPLKSGKFATWNAGNCCAGARDKNIDDVGFVRDIIKTLKSQVNIDPDKIFATGMSNGALFAYRLACEMPDVISAIASVAGSDGTTSCNPSRPVSILEIHAQNDEMVLFNGGSGKDTKMLANFVSVPETISRWVKRDSCSVPAKRVIQVPGAHCDAYTGCRDNAEVELCVTDSGGHSWPGGFKVRTNAPGSTAINANDIMWDFFLRSR